MSKSFSHSSHVLVSATLIGLWLFMLFHLKVSWTPSLSERVFWLEAPVDLKSGDVVVFRRKDRATRGNNLDLLKRVACVEGDLLQVRNRSYFCNGRFLGAAKETALSGEPVANFIFSGTVPTGRIFVMGDHKDSYDSRYYGFIDKREIKAKALAIF